MTFILKPDLDIVKMYHHTKNEVSMSPGSKVIAQADTHTDTQTDGQTDTHTHRHDENITSTAHAGGKKKRKMPLQVFSASAHRNVTVEASFKPGVIYGRATASEMNRLRRHDPLKSEYSDF